MATAVKTPPVATASTPKDLRRITEADPDYQKLHQQTTARLARSVRQYIREEQRGEQGADSRFIQRHVALMKQAYIAAHHEGQKDYWPAVSKRTVQHRFMQPDEQQTQKRLTYYALGSVLKLAHQVKTYVQQGSFEEPTTSNVIALAAPAPATDLPGDYGQRVALQGQITWSGIQDGYSDAGGNDSATPYTALYWLLEPGAQHCQDCPDIAMGSPYDPPWAGTGSNQLNQTPGDGQTECGAACKCSLSYDSPSGDALVELGQAIQDKWNDWYPSGMDAEGNVLTQPLQPPKSGTALTDEQKSALDQFRNSADMWDTVRRQLPPMPSLFGTEDLPTPLPAWEELTAAQQAVVKRVEQAQEQWLNAAGKLVPAPILLPDPATEMRKWLEKAGTGAFTPWWNEMEITPSQEDDIEAWLDAVARGEVVQWPTPAQPAEYDAMQKWLDWASTHVDTQAGGADINTDFRASETEIQQPVIQLANNYPRQSGGRFGFGPGKTTGGTGRAKGTGAKGGAGKTSKAKASTAASTTSHQPTREELKAAAEGRLATAQKNSNKADRDFKKAEKDAEAKRITNADEINRVSALRGEAYIRDFHSYGDAREAIAEERARAKGEAGKTKSAVTNYEKMQAAEQPLAEAKANYEAAEATANASKAIADDLQNRYYDHAKYGYNFDKMGKDHPDWKAAERQRWKDESAKDKASRAYYRAKSKYETPRNALAGKISDADIEARPERIAAHTALKELDAQLGELTGSTAVRQAFDERAAAQLSLKDAQEAMNNPSWKYTLYSAPTTHGIYTSPEQWPGGTVTAAMSAGGGDQKNGDLALSELGHAQGFDGKPDIVTEDELQTFVNNGEVELWRGDTNNHGNYTDDMMEGPYHVGLGIRGNGTYAQEASYDGANVAKSYATNRGQTQGKGRVMRMSVKSDARVINYSDLQDESGRAWQRAKSSQQDATNRGDRSAARHYGTLAWLASSTSNYAVAMGYDAVRIDSGSGQGQWIILNRTSVRISHQTRSGS